MFKIKLLKHNEEIDADGSQHGSYTIRFQSDPANKAFTFRSSTLFIGEDSGCDEVTVATGSITQYSLDKKNWHEFPTEEELYPTIQAGEKIWLCVQWKALENRIFEKPMEGRWEYFSYPYLLFLDYANGTSDSMFEDEYYA